MSHQIHVYQTTPGQPASPPLPLQAMKLDWYGQPARHKVEYSLSLQGRTLSFAFRAEKTPECDFTHGRGDFVEGLWEQDVAELFVMGPGGDYQELNLSPTGAWWCATFSDYRQRSAVTRCPSVRTKARRDESSWSAELFIEIDDLVVVPKGLTEARLNVASILCPGQPEYLCSGHNDGGEPDFHLAVNFLPALLV